jgi:predicted Zn finger-like uncharacterized protein
MQIACPNCATSYRIEVSALGERGRSVRCVRCRKVWFATALEPARVLETVGADDAPHSPAEPATEVAAFRSELGAQASAPESSEPPAEPAAEAPASQPAVAEVSEPAADAAPAETATIAEPAAETPPPPTIEIPLTGPGAALADIPIPVVEAPPLVPTGDEHQEPRRESGPEDIERAAIRRQAQKDSRRRTKSRQRITAAIILLALVCGAVLVLRKPIVRHMPQLASFYASIGMPVNLRGLVFGDLKISRETHDGVQVLVVEGVITNTVSSTVEVPRLRFGMRNAAGAEIYSWTAVPTQETLEPGDKLPFRSRLASPPDDGHDVEVRFFTRRDAVAGPR